MSAEEEKSPTGGEPIQAIALDLLIRELPPEERARTRVSLYLWLRELYRRSGLSEPEWLKDELTKVLTEVFPQLFEGLPEEERGAVVSGLLAEVSRAYEETQVDAPPRIADILARWGA